MRPAPQRLGLMVRDGAFAPPHEGDATGLAHADIAPICSAMWNVADRRSRALLSNQAIEGDRPPASGFPSLVACAVPFLKRHRCLRLPLQTLKRDVSRSQALVLGSGEADSDRESQALRFDFQRWILQQSAANGRSPRAMPSDRVVPKCQFISMAYKARSRRRECYLCNTWPKTLRTAPFCGAPLLPVHRPWVMVRVRRRGASRSRPVWEFRYKSLALMRGCPKSAKRPGGGGT